MNIRVLLVFILIHSIGFTQSKSQIKANQGRVSFFSYTSAENIEAINNQAASIIDVSQKTIAVQMLLNTFIFKKALMQEHFNESYVESDIYPNATLSGVIEGFDPVVIGKQTRIIKGELELHGVKQQVEIKADIDNSSGSYIVTGDFEAGVKDYDIRVPTLLAGNIAKVIKVTFRFEYQPYETN